MFKEQEKFQFFLHQNFEKNLKKGFCFKNIKKKRKKDKT